MNSYLVERIIDGQRIYCLRRGTSIEHVKAMFDVPVTVIELDFPIPHTSKDIPLIEEKCLECGKDATWIRSTQFAGEHPYCEEHATKEKDFGENDSYAYWYRPKDE